MKAQIWRIGLVCMLLFCMASMPVLASASCPYTTGHQKEPACEVEILPLERFFGDVLTIKVGFGLDDDLEPVAGEKVEMSFYDLHRARQDLKFNTDDTGQLLFKPRAPGHHLIKTCDKAILFYVNSTCGDGICMRVEESREDCPEDCARCGDGVCDPTEDMGCMDCHVCGDGECSTSENSISCPEDCADEEAEENRGIDEALVERFLYIKELFLNLVI